ncbi:unnamed protein product, partial [Arabidopsis halleri]
QEPITGTQAQKRKRLQGKKALEEHVCPKEENIRLISPQKGQADSRKEETTQEAKKNPRGKEKPA